MTKTRDRQALGRGLAGAVFGCLLVGTGCAAGSVGAEDPGLQTGEDMRPTEPCPAELTAAQLTGKVELGSADIDGDGRVDPVVMGTVPAGGAGCRVAVVATTASGTLAAPVAGAREAVGRSPLAAPAFAQVDGAAGDEIVVTTSWNPRGGGALAMFSWVDGELVQVKRGGQPWELFATVDDGGGLPQLLTCRAGGFAEVTAYPPGLDAGSTVTSYALDRGELTVRDRAVDRTATYEQVKAGYPDLPRAGVAVLPDCQ